MRAAYVVAEVKPRSHIATPDRRHVSRADAGLLIIYPKSAVADKVTGGTHGTRRGVQKNTEASRALI